MTGLLQTTSARRGGARGRFCGMTGLPEWPGRIRKKWREMATSATKVRVANRPRTGYRLRAFCGPTWEKTSQTAKRSRKPNRPSWTSRDSNVITAGTSSTRITPALESESREATTECSISRKTSRSFGRRRRLAAENAKFTEKARGGRRRNASKSGEVQ